MTTLGDLVLKVRSKNAGPFWVTIDIFCDDPAVYDRLTRDLSTDRVAALYRTAPGTLKRFDMHGAQYAALLEELTLD